MRFIAFLIFVGTLFTSNIFAQGNEYFSYKAQKGDGVYSILRQFNLGQHNCNHTQFYILNGLEKNASLRVGTVYYLPMIVHDYNGKSIRSTIGIDDWEMAVRIQEFNRKLVKKNLFKAQYEKSGSLLVPYHEMHCSDQEVAKIEEKGEPNTPPKVDTAKPVKSGDRTYPIFGSKYAYTPLESKKLKGKVYYIVSGHGGPDPGAVGKRSNKQLCEDEYAYDVALRLTRILISHGATAYMIVRDTDGIRDGEFLKCDTDETVWGGNKIPRRQKTRLFQRSNKINELYEKHRRQGVTEQKSIVIHVDSRSKSQRADVFFYYFPGSKLGKKLAKKIHRTLAKKYKKFRRNRNYDGTVTARDLHMLRESKPTSVYIELGNIKNPNDQKRLILKSNRDVLAKWLYEGLMAK